MFENYPSVIHLTRKVHEEMPNHLTHKEGQWVPCRNMGYCSFGQRCRAAWLVFTGKADALIWPGGQ